MKNNRGLIFRIFLCIFLTFVMLGPFALILLTSFKNKKEAAELKISWPTEWHIIENYTEVFQSGVARAFVNSCIITISVIVAVILLSSVAAFVIQRSRSKVSEYLDNYFVLGLLIPLQMIPVYMICNFLHIKNIAAVILICTSCHFPLAIFLYTGAMKSIPRDIDEAAIIDGASPLCLFFKVIFPLLKPMTVTLVVLIFMAVWNDFGTTIYFLNSPKYYTLVLTIYNFFGVHSADWNLIFADVVIISLPVIILYFCAQKHIMSGMTSGAVKG